MFSKSASSWFGSEISFSVFSPGQPALAVTQKPSSPPSSGQTSEPASPCRNNDAGKVFKSHEIKHDGDSSKGTHPTESSQVETKTPDLNQLTKDQQLEEEERLLLAKIHQMTSGTSPVSSPRGMKRLILDPCEIERDTTELAEPLATPGFDALPGTEGVEPLATGLGPNQEGELDA